MGILTYNGRPLDCSSYLANPSPYNFLSFVDSGYSWERVFGADLSSQDIYGDGTHYFEDFGESSSVHHRALNTSTNTWDSYDGFTIDGTSNKTKLYLGRYVWSFQGNYYYSYYGTQKFINLSRRTIRDKTWSGLTSFLGENTWSDGDPYTMYMSSGTRHYILMLYNGSYVWANPPWDEKISFSGINVWKDLKNNVYYSNGTTHYQFNKSSSTWSEKTWYGLSEFNGLYVWNNNRNIFVSDDNHNMYMLNTSTSTWSQITFGGPWLRPMGRHTYWYDGNLYWGEYKLNFPS